MLRAWSHNYSAVHDVAKPISVVHHDMQSFINVSVSAKVDSAQSHTVLYCMLESCSDKYYCTIIVIV